MRRLVLIILLNGLLVLPVLAGTGPQDIAKTPHNLSSTQPDLTLRGLYSASNEDEVCVFCHTPHGGSLDGPLWNRDLTTITGSGKYTHYTSATLSTTVGASNRAVNPESLLCLSCHDGSISIGDKIINTGGVTPNNNIKFVQPGFGGNPGPKIGGVYGDTSQTNNLSDDHPISFSYSDVLTDKPGTLQTVTYVEDTKNLVLFGSSETVECSTCHDPHVNYLSGFGGDSNYAPFLAIPNTGSAMCLSCHIK